MDYFAEDIMRPALLESIDEATVIDQRGRAVKGDQGYGSRGTGGGSARGAGSTRSVGFSKKVSFKGNPKSGLRGRLVGTGIAAGAGYAFGKLTDRSSGKRREGISEAEEKRGFGGRISQAASDQVRIIAPRKSDKKNKISIGQRFDRSVDSTARVVAPKKYNPGKASHRAAAGYAIGGPFGAGAAAGRNRKVKKESLSESGFFLREDGNLQDRHGNVFAPLNESVHGKIGKFASRHKPEIAGTALGGGGFMAYKAMKGRKKE